ncbi:MAG: hypothetical protein ACLGI6_06510, partial [Gammaproteobacteria bacterium]
MNLQDQVLYRCVHGACAKLLPRQVNYCPYCGVSQRDGTRASVAAVSPPPPAPAVPSVPPAPPAPAPAVAIDKPAVPVPEPQAAGPAPAPAPAAAAAATPAAPRRPAVPPQREPIRMRYWLLALLALWAIWMFTKPDKAKVEQRIVSAMALADDCKLSEAQGELIALRSKKA